MTKKNYLRRIFLALILGTLSTNQISAATYDQAFNLNPEFEQAFGYSMATQAGCLLFIGGIVSINEIGELVGPGDVTFQTEQLYRQLEAVLEAHKLTLKDVVQESFYVTNLKTMQYAGAVRAKKYERAGAVPPSTAGMEISGLGMPGAEIEMTAIAYKCR